VIRWVIILESIVKLV